MTYTVKELFLTVQAEGSISAARRYLSALLAANLWSGREEDGRASHAFGSVRFKAEASE
jgi:hypothetical protein